MRESDVSWWQFPPPVASSQYLAAVKVIVPAADAADVASPLAGLLMILPRN